MRCSSAAKRNEASTGNPEAESVENGCFESAPAVSTGGRLSTNEEENFTEVGLTLKTAGIIFSVNERGLPPAGKTKCGRSGRERGFPEGALLGLLYTSAPNAAFLRTRRQRSFVDRLGHSLLFGRMPLTLLVLAAGLGSRYGGLKQIDPVGPNGETVLDYAVFDAVQCGFDRVVFVIREEFAAVFREKIGSKYSGRVAVDYVFQALDALPAGFAAPSGRTKPWGTGHAVWCARAAIRENFAVINADDFYGRDSLQRLAAFLGAARNTRYAMVGFELAKTLSEHGAVSRGLCTVGPDGHLRQVVKQTGILHHEVGPQRKFADDAIVSMNCWGFTPALFPALETQLRSFLAVVAADPATPREFYLPAAVSTLIEQGRASVQVLPTNSTWFGITFREDRPRVQAALAALVAAGKYPAKLF